MPFRREFRLRSATGMSPRVRQPLPVPQGLENPVREVPCLASLKKVPLPPVPNQLREAPDAGGDQRGSRSESLQCEHRTVFEPEARQHGQV